MNRHVGRGIIILVILFIIIFLVLYIKKLYNKLYKKEHFDNDKININGNNKQRQIQY